MIYLCLREHYRGTAFRGVCAQACVLHWCLVGCVCKRECARTHKVSAQHVTSSLQGFPPVAAGPQ